MLLDTTTVKENVIITNLTEQETIYSGNRFLVYALYPEQNIDLRVMWGREKQNVVFSCGKSILNRTSKTDVGNLMLKYMGGGHSQVGTCQVPIDAWTSNLDEIVDQLITDG